MSFCHMMTTSPASSEYETTTQERSCVISAHRETANAYRIFNCLHEAELLQLCSLQSHRIEHGSSPDSSERIGTRCMYRTVTHTCSWLTKVTSLLQDSDAHLHGQPVYLTDVIVDHTSSWTLRSSGKDILVGPRFRTQFAARVFRDAASETWNDLPIHIRSPRCCDEQLPERTKYTSV